jgi:hypothetical protein
MPDEFRNTGFCLTPSHKALLVLGYDATTEDEWERLLGSHGERVFPAAIEHLTEELERIQSQNRHDASDSLEALRDTINDSCDTDDIGEWPEWLEMLALHVDEAILALGELEGCMDKLDLPERGRDGLDADVEIAEEV